MGFLITVAGLVGLVWAGLFVARAGVFSGCVVLLVIGSFFGHAFAHYDVGPLTVTLDRLLLGLLLVGAALQRRWGRPLRPRWRTEDSVLAAWIALLVVGSLVHWPEADHSVLMGRLVYFFVLPAVFYWLVRESPVSARQLRATMAVVAAVAVYLAWLGMAEVVGLSGIVFPRYIASPEYEEFLGRARGPFLNPVANGFFMVCGWYVLSLWWSETRGWQRAVAGIAWGLVACGLGATLTRSVWLGAAVGFLALAGLQLPKMRRMALVGLVVVAGFVVVATQWEHVNAFKRDRYVSVNDMRKSASLRPVLARVAWRMFQDQPLWGCGLGQYRERSLPYLSEHTGDVPLDTSRGYVQHNAFLALLTEAGLPASLLYVVLLGFWAWNGWRLWVRGPAEGWPRRTGLLWLAVFGFYAVNAMLHDVSIMPMVHMLIFFLAGLVGRLIDQTSSAPAHHGSWVFAPAVADSQDRPLSTLPSSNRLPGRG